MRDEPANLKLVDEAEPDHLQQVCELIMHICDSVAAGDIRALWGDASARLHAYVANLATTPEGNAICDIAGVDDFFARTTIVTALLRGCRSPEEHQRVRIRFLGTVKEPGRKGVSYALDIVDKGDPEAN